MPTAHYDMLRHFADPRVAMVAPRVLGLESEAPNWITRYEDARSSLEEELPRTCCPGLFAGIASRWSRAGSSHALSWLD